MKFLLVIGLSFLVVGCSTMHTRRDATALISAENEALIVQIENGSLKEFKPCGEIGAEECSIYNKRFRTMRVNEIVVIESIIDDNTTCCTTIFIGGKKIQRCSTFIGPCPPGWWLQ